LSEPDHDRRRVLAHRSAERGWSVRVLETEIARTGKPAARSPNAHPDQHAVAAVLADAIGRATGCEVQATPHRRGFRIVLDQAGAQRLARILEPETAAL
jgi:hypothetical protein